MKFQIITLFPEMFTPLEHSIIGRAQRDNLCEWRLFQLRDYAINKHGQVDDTPYGGEAGMVIRPEPLAAAIRDTEPADEVIFLTPQGQTFTQADAKELATKKSLTFVCGHYKGIDERIRKKFITKEYSIGDYVLTGGEIPAMAMIDAITRLLPKALGHRESAENDSFYQSRLAWPIYTKPQEFEGEQVPKVLLSGHHGNIAKWRAEESLKRTQERRPDLLEE